MADGLTNVEMAPSGNAYCGFCDTAIEERTPRVVRSYFNGPSARWQEDCTPPALVRFSSQRLLMKLSCGVTSTCVGCNLPLDKNDHVISIFSGPPPCPRFMPSESCGALHYCYACCGAFLSQHRSLLNGFFCSRFPTFRYCVIGYAHTAYIYLLCNITVRIHTVADTVRVPYSTSYSTVPYRNVYRKAVAVTPPPYSGDGNHEPADHRAITASSKAYRARSIQEHRALAMAASASRRQCASKSTAASSCMRMSPRRARRGLEASSRM